MVCGDSSVTSQFSSNWKIPSILKVVGPPANSPFLLRFLIAMRSMPASWIKALTLAASSSSSRAIFLMATATCARALPCKVAMAKMASLPLISMPQRVIGVLGKKRKGLEFELVGFDAEGRGNFLASCLAGLVHGLLLSVGRLGDAQALGHFILRQIQIFTPGANGRGTIHNTADYLVGNQIGFRLLRHILRIRYDDERRPPVGAVDDLDFSRYVHRVS